jgi:hypothetical protein
MQNLKERHLSSQQSSYQLWHLLHAYEGDDSPSGNEKLYELLEKKFGSVLNGWAVKF